LTHHLFLDKKVGHITGKVNTIQEQLEDFREAARQAVVPVEGDDDEWKVDTTQLNLFNALHTVSQYRDEIIAVEVDTNNEQEMTYTDLCEVVEDQGKKWVELSNGVFADQLIAFREMLEYLEEQHKADGGGDLEHSTETKPRSYSNINSNGTVASSESLSFNAAAPLSSYGSTLPSPSPSYSHGSYSYPSASPKYANGAVAASASLNYGVNPGSTPAGPTPSPYGYSPASSYSAPTPPAAYSATSTYPPQPAYKQPTQYPPPYGHSTSLPYPVNSTYSSTQYVPPFSASTNYAAAASSPRTYGSNASQYPTQSSVYTPPAAPQPYNSSLSYGGSSGGYNEGGGGSKPPAGSGYTRPPVAPAPALGAALGAGGRGRGRGATLPAWMTKGSDLPESDAKRQRTR
jgi:hypothetical protein